MGFIPMPTACGIGINPIRRLLGRLRWHHDAGAQGRRAAARAFLPNQAPAVSHISHFSHFSHARRREQ
ncbi:hypothetical protein A9975_20230 [Cupriavidus sp. UME77]|nr:hypothetical protein [Cupriavidus sp. UME77]